MEQSILKSTKKILGVGDDDPSFDLDIITHINSAFSDLHDLGLGPQAGFVIDDEAAEWATFVPNDADHRVQHSRIKTFVFLKTRLLFDPPQTTYHLNAVQEQLKEVTWRLNVKREESDWVDPEPDPDLIVVDGGTPLGP